ncbi:MULTISPECIES: SDR family NAD(P)-dependent oxidoreductase [unclassified Ruegeria]|uniref:SDR family NAD(P)-dependent oxidoreductase n=1 Tax=unclassified Ruegeria TaxID=2625375 RepID=UPI0014880098|nr:MULTISPECIES: SDR family NAD(P)-dependent oxidoreductase [unclassified Ruegeria]NOD76619.1 SDR family NAD(P)-dependent oxidoreductase [Ruegeria sp. HKCCD4332]NOD89339.1 SDR family NAD(P)-dependent oxidoreductase [Ruegeria sp. HKCCD4318]NOE13498.1 SDR family NAD(P)-dependent oxidoreductase [Ruegeria sp. HKCCD4318-2]NOG07753.1 SDR family NAD(P)-dependent oxidoreductase [Ruegeria sp. HKCCD4315]
MKTALIIGASGGIGAAVCRALEAQGVSVTGLSRSLDEFDLTDPDRALLLLDGLPDPFDLILVASGALEIEGAAPEKTIRAVSAKAMMDQFALNAVGPALVLSRAHRLLPRKRRSVFAVLSARVGSIGDNRMGGWISYRAAKAAVNQVVHTSAIELSRTHKQAICVALHPGTVKTAFTQKYLNRHPAVEPEDAAQNLVSVINGLTPADTGGFFDWAGQPVPW